MPSALTASMTSGHHGRGCGQFARPLSVKDHVAGGVPMDQNAVKDIVHPGQLTFPGEKGRGHLNGHLAVRLLTGISNELDNAAPVGSILHVLEG